MSIIDDAAKYAETVFRQNVQPVYNGLGRNIGYYDTPQQLAAGIIHVFQGEVAGPPSEWMIKCGILGVTRNAGQCLISQHIMPVWYSSAQTQVAKDAAKPADIVQPAITIPDFNLPFVGEIKDTAAKYAVIGGIGLLGILLITRRRA